MTPYFFAVASGRQDTHMRAACCTAYRSLLSITAEKAVRPRQEADLIHDWFHLPLIQNTTMVNTAYSLIAFRAYFTLSHNILSLIWRCFNVSARKMPLAILPASPGHGDFYHRCSRSNKFCCSSSLKKHYSSFLRSIYIKIVDAAVPRA